MTMKSTLLSSPPLRGRGLRFVLVDLLMGQPECTVSELVSALDAAGYRLDGRPSKVISDALRWEVRRGRVDRVARGRYRYVSAPQTTARRIRLLAERSRRWLRARQAGLRPPPTPPEPRPSLYTFFGHPSDPPWLRLGWLWVT